MPFREPDLDWDIFKPNGVTVSQGVGQPWNVFGCGGCSVDMERVQYWPEGAVDPDVIWMRMCVEYGP